MTPEEKARQKIDELLKSCGWTLQDKAQVNLSAARGVAVREAALKSGEADYLLFADGKAIATVEAKPESLSLTGVEEQSSKYTAGIHKGFAAWKIPLPFSYESDGIETRFSNHLDPDPRSRNVYAFHRPETLLAWVQPDKQLARRLREFRHWPKPNFGPCKSQPFTASRNLTRPDPPRAHPNGHGFGEDLYCGQFHLSPREIRRCAACPLSRGSRQSRQADPQRIPAVRLAR